MKDIKPNEIIDLLRLLKLVDTKAKWAHVDNFKEYIEIKKRLSFDIRFNEYQMKYRPPVFQKEPDDEDEWLEKQGPDMEC